LTNEELHYHLQNQIRHQLPGYDAHRLVAPYRFHPDKYKDQWSSARQSAVLIQLFQKDNVWHSVLMERSVYDGKHSGQISFPGGKMEAEDDNYIDTALRETFEEVGIDRSSIDIVGEISQLYIPPSNFLVQPVIGINPNEPSFNIDPVEVQKAIPFPLYYLEGEGRLKRMKMRHSSNVVIDTPYFDIDGHVVWGATAMMLSELRSLLSAINFFK